MRLGVPRRAGRIGKRVRIPRGRATVKIVANERRCKSQETCPDAVCSLRTPRARVFRPPWKFSSEKRSRRQPVAFAWQKGRRVLSFQLTLECTDNGSALDSPRDPKRRRATLVAALQILLIAMLIVLGTSSCFDRQKKTSTSTTREVVDEAGRHVQLATHIDRIVSLAPNLTEIVYAVGAGEHLVGDTEYCDYPAAPKNVAKIGDTIHPRIERIMPLKPHVAYTSTAPHLET